MNTEPTSSREECWEGPQSVFAALWSGREGAAAEEHIHGIDVTGLTMFQRGDTVRNRINSSFEQVEVVRGSASVNWRDGAGLGGECESSAQLKRLGELR